MTERIEKKANHQANVVQITEILPHTNADNLVIIHIGEYQVVTRKDEFKVGDFGVYIQPDSVVPQTEPFKFIWESSVDPVNPQPVSEKKRRITVRKFRGEWSEGLLMPVTSFEQFKIVTGEAILTDTESYDIGDDVSDLLGVTHYELEDTTRGTNFTPKARKRGYPKSLRGWIGFLTNRVKRFFGFGNKLVGSNIEEDSLGLPTYDVESFKHYSRSFQDDEQVVITEKIHGSNARYVYLDGVMYAGSKNYWKAPDSDCIWRKVLKANPWIEEWCKANEGYALYGEVTPTQDGYDYGSKQPQFFVFDIRTPDGKWAEETDIHWISVGIEHRVPVLYRGVKPSSEELTKLTSGLSTVAGTKHIREGIVIRVCPERRIRGVGRAQLKLVSSEFLEKDGKK